jgi:undecaprenyl phosphate-alpha-L-ara4N flippase subunit ArnE
MKLAMIRTPKESGLVEVTKSAAKSLPAAVGVLCFIIALVLYLYVLSRMPLSVAYPIMTAAAFAIVASASQLLFSESISVRQIAGFVLIVCGIYLVAK